MSASADRGEDQRFTPTSGTVIGWVGIGVCVIALASIAMEAHTVVGARYAFAVAICGVVVWCFMLRSRLIIGATEIELRNAFSSWHVSLASVRRVAVRALTR